MNNGSEKKCLRSLASGLMSFGPLTFPCIIEDVLTNSSSCLWQMLIATCSRDPSKLFAGGKYC